MKKILLFILVLTQYCAFSQQWIWAKDNGKYHTISDARIKTNPAGDVWTSVTNSFQPSAILLKKENAMGTLQWSKTIGGSNTYMTDLSVDKFNNCYMLGFYANDIIFPDTNITGASAWQGFLVAYNNAGTRKWVKLYTTNANWGNYIANDAAGNLIHAGSNANGTNTTTITKYAPSGAMIWQKTYVLSSSINGLKTDKKNNIYITGMFTGSLSINGTTHYPNQNVPYYEKSFVWRLNSNGDPEKVQVLEGARILDMGVDSTCMNYYINGLFSDSAQIGQTKIKTACTSNPPAICEESFVVRLDSFNVCWWAKRNVENFSRLDVSPVGDTYLTGDFMDSLNIDAITLKEPETRRSVFIVKIGKNGTAQWAMRDSGEYLTGNFVDDISRSESGAVYITGTFHNFNNNCWFGTHILPITGTVTHCYSASLYEYIAPPMGLTTLNSEQGNTTVFPNPGNGVFTLIADPDAKISAVYDMFGRNIIGESLLEGNQLNLSGKEKGVYLVEVKSNGERQLKKIVLQ